MYAQGEVLKNTILKKQGERDGKGIQTGDKHADGVIERWQYSMK